MSTFSSLLMLNRVNGVSKWGMSSPSPAFMDRFSSLLYRLLVPARHAQKWLNLWRRPSLWHPPEISLVSVKPQQSLSLLIGALLKSWKNTTIHCCCPISAVILTTSELEANLENQHLASVLYACESGGWHGCREGGKGGSRPYDGSYLVVKRGGGEGQTAKSCPVSNCSYVMYNVPIGFSFSFLTSCWRNLSRYKKGSGRSELCWQNIGVDKIWAPKKPCSLGFMD